VTLPQNGARKWYAVALILMSLSFTLAFIQTGAMIREQHAARADRAKVAQALAAFAARSASAIHIDSALVDLDSTLARRTRASIATLSRRQGLILGNQAHILYRQAAILKAMKHEGIKVDTAQSTRASK
jgi:hypothetical protein